MTSGYGSVYRLAHSGIHLALRHKRSARQSQHLWDSSRPDNRERMNFYFVIDGELVIQDKDQEEVWRGKPEGHAVVWAAPIPKSEDGLVLYDPYPPGWKAMQHTAFPNLVRMHPDGAIVWRAELPDPENRYLAAKLTHSGVSARALDYNIELDLNAGKILERIWTK